MKNFRLNIFVRVFLLVASLGASVYFFIILGLKAAAIFIGLIAITQIVSLIYFVEQTNRTLSRFFLGIKYDDFTATLHQEAQGKTFNELNQQLNEVVDHFRAIRMEKEENYRYLEQVFHHLSVPTISIKNNEEINFLNPAARQLFSSVILRTVNDLDPALIREIQTMKSGEKRNVKLVRDQEVLQLIVSSTTFKLRQTDYKLISFQNIRSELERKEVDAWQKLIRVLTHEIMNSVTPISTLTDSLNTMLFSRQNGSFLGSDITPSQAEDIRQAIHIIRSRSGGLMDFVQSYRNVTQIPPPELAIVSVKPLLDNVKRLFDARIKKEEIHFLIQCNPTDLEVWADEQMLEQILINLIINAIHAVDETPKKEIILEAGINPFGGVEIKVMDNGKGIPEDQIDEIFIPFFSTKKEGSGVGLSISRQLIQAQGGHIQVKSEVGKGTIFVLGFGG
jgi:two-component system nitrogen regulation sensor histidine kinase NtrY